MSKKTETQTAVTLIAVIVLSTGVGCNLLFHRGEDQSAWRDKLTPNQFYVAREGGTERAFTGE